MNQKCSNGFIIYISPMTCRDIKHCAMHVLRALASALLLVTLKPIFTGMTLVTSLASHDGLP